MSKTNKPYIYTVIRIPKSGSQSLRASIEGALPDSNYYRIPRLHGSAEENFTTWEKFKVFRSQRRRFIRDYNAITEAGMWSHIDNNAKSGDVVSGHFSYGRPALVNFEKRYITIIRNPVTRVVSDYNYSGFRHNQTKPFYHLIKTGKQKQAASHSFSDYLSFLLEHKEIYGNPATKYIVGKINNDPYDQLKTNFFHYGTLENFEKFSLTLCEKLRAPVKTTWTNKTPPKKALEIKKSDQKLIELLFDMDLSLYEKIKYE